MSEGPIPWMAVNTYCEVHGITGELREDFEYLVKRLDLEYMKYRNASAKAK